jgi:ABC-type antimicrobial peptide transport system permease subunit
LKLNDDAYTIVGVMPASASVASWAAMACDIWVPMALTDEQRATRGNHNQQGVARLKAGVELAQARSEMDAISTQLGREFPKTDKGWGAVIIPMQDEIVGDSRTMLVMLLGAVGLVLLIACANAANLLFTRALSRRKEIAIRSALGARTSDVLRLVIVEGMSPTLVGIAAGTIAALASARVMERLIFGVSASDPLTLAAVAATLALVALMSSLVPAYRALRLDPVKVLRAD